MKKFTFKLEAAETRNFGQLLTHIGLAACKFEDPTAQISALVLGDWVERKRGRLVFPEAGKYTMSVAEAFALHHWLSDYPTHDKAYSFTNLLAEVDKYVVTTRGLRNTQFDAIQDGETL